MHPPVPLFVLRECMKETKIDGYDIPLKAGVLVNAWAIGRDPESRRMCPGMLFGLANVGQLLAQLLYHFDWKLPNGQSHQSLDMTESPGVSATRKDDLILIATPYDS
ncbi:hypothetical protein HAX54_000079 [Datura stramonium]|uniref:Cytochrome P450 n=1 Tax=Datura stramonium TaxID=4076 RepID=A0ABS8RFX4_DATST|nr:hypothetical protein [Datura stramonium]